MDRAAERDSLLRQLGAPPAHARYAGVVSAVETIETHMSWVFVVGDHVVKLKKPVRYAFLDFSTPAAREACCREEVRLNSRLAPGVYRGVMALQSRAGRLQVVPEAEADASAATIDWLVWMRRLPRERMLDHAIAEGRVTLEDVDTLAAALITFYRGATEVEVDAGEYIARFAREQALLHDLLLRPGFTLDAAAIALERFAVALQRHAASLRARAVQRRIVDGHGDLRPEHVCLLRPPVVIDCLEFNAALRQVDPLDELAFLALECELGGAAWIGPRLVARYVAALDDRPDAVLLPLYTAYRALLRARLAVAHLLDPQPRTPARWRPLAQRYVDRALIALEATEIAVKSPTTRGSP
jgi:aminoglycoside phosphotransferase family enzyme